MFPHFVLDRGKPGTLVVDSSGRRFVNEAISYHQFALEMLANGKSAIPAFLDRGCRGCRKYGLGMVRPGGGGQELPLADGYMIAGDTIEQLAQRLKVDPGNLRETVDEMNNYAHTGRDTEFGRGARCTKTITGTRGVDPTPISGGSRPRRSMRFGFIPPISVHRRVLSPTMPHACGFRQSADRRTLRCGNDMQSVMGGTYPGTGLRSDRRSCSPMSPHRTRFGRSDHRKRPDR